MKLRDLSIHAAHQVELPTHFDAKDFNQSCWHIQEMFLFFLPNNYVLDGAGKANIICGSEGERYQYQIILNVNTYYVEDFDFEIYANSTNKQREMIILDTVRSALVDIANRVDADPQPIIDAANQILEFDFCLSIEKKCSRSTRSRQLKLKVIREIRYGGEDWYINICNRKNEFLERVLIQENTNFVESGYAYKKSKWLDNDFVIFDHIDNESFRLNVLPYLVKYCDS